MSRPREALILEVSERHARLASVCRDGPRPRLKLLCSAAPAAPTRDVLALADKSVLESLTTVVRDQGLAGRNVACLVGGSAVASQHFEMPPMPPAALQSAIRLKLGQQLHYDVQSAQLWISAPRAGTTGKWYEAVTLAGPQAALVASACDRIGLTLTAVSATPSALAELAGLFAPSSGAGLIAALHVSDNGSALIVRDGDRVLVSTPITFGLEQFTAALQRPILGDGEPIQLDAAAARRLRDAVGIPPVGVQLPGLEIPSDRILPLLEPVLQQGTKQITQWLSFARTNAPDQAVTSLTVMGAGAALPGLADSLGLRLKLTARTALCRDLADVDGASAERLAACVGWSLARRPLPDLTPADIRRRQRVRRLGRCSALLGPAVVGGLLVMTLLLRQIGGGLSQAEAGQREVMQQSLEALQRWEVWQTLARQTNHLNDRLHEFAQASPRWDAVFKELSVILPPAARLTRLAARRADEQLVLRLSADLASGGARSFDELVEEMLAVLQGSPFFYRVEVLSAVSATEEQAARRLLGTIVVDLFLVHPTAKATAAATPEGA